MHYKEMFLKDESNDLDLELGMEILDQEEFRVEGTLRSMITSLHGVKKYLTLKVLGQAGE